MSDGSLIGGLKPYPRMRDSGVPWLGLVPTHWNIQRLKYLLRERDSRSLTGSEQLLRVSQYTGVTERKRDDGVDEPDTRAESLVGYKLVDPNELVVNIMLAWNGSLGVSSYAGITSPAYCVYKFGSGVEPWYFHHLLRSPTYKARIKAVSTGVVESRLRLYSDDLYRLEAIVPPPSEQAAIVRFLDHANRRIRKYVRAKQKLIKLIEEQKQAEIYDAVTGIGDWISWGETAGDWRRRLRQGWGVLPLRRLVDVRRGITYGIVQPGEPDSSGVMMVRGKDYSRGWASPESIFRVSHAIENPYSRSRLKVGDLVITIVGAGVGNVAVVPAWLDGANITQTTARVAVDRAVALPEYLELVLESPIGRWNLDRYVYGAAQPRLNLPHVGAFEVPVPPIDEQAEIVSAIQESLGSIERSAERIRREISLLSEYRTRLVADVVIGKVDVRDAAARLSDQLNESRVEEGDDLADAENLEEQEAVSEEVDT